MSGVKSEGERSTTYDAHSWSEEADGEEIVGRRDAMKKKISKTKNDTMRHEYDFRGGVRGKHYHAMQGGYTITVRKADGKTTVKHVKPAKGAVILEPEIQKYFPDSDSVNATLRSLVRLIRTERRADTKKRG